MNSDKKVVKPLMDESTTPSGVLVLIAFIASILVLTCLMSPVAMDILALTLGEHGFPFSRVFHRVALLAALLSLFLFRRHLKFRFTVKQFFPSSKVLSRIGVGVALSFGTGLLGLVLLLLTEGAALKEGLSSSYVARKLLFLLPTMFLIAFIEEIFFRGWLQRIAQKRFGLLLGLLGIALIYSTVHFIAPTKDFVFVSGDYLAGFGYIQAVMLYRFGSLAIAPAVIVLAFIGLIMGYTAYKTNGLEVSVGLHAGWVGIMKVSTYFTDLKDRFPEGPMGRYVILTDPIIISSVLIVSLVVFTYYRETGIRE